MSEASLWDQCSTHGCKNKRQHPAACCATCLSELYGYGRGLGKEPGSSGRLVEPAKTLTHLPKIPTQQSPGMPMSLETQLKMKIAELTERVGLVERAFESYKQTPLDTVPEQFRDLQPFTTTATIPSGAYVAAKVEPYNVEGGFPRYCAIHAHRTGFPDNVVHLRLGSVEIGRVPQLQIGSRDFKNYISTKFYDLRYGAPVNWAALDVHHPNRCATFYLMNPDLVEMGPATVDIELWCDVNAYHEGRYPPHLPSTPFR